MPGNRTIQISLLFLFIPHVSIFLVTCQLFDVLRWCRVGRGALKQLLGGWCNSWFCYWFAGFWINCLLCLSLSAVNRLKCLPPLWSALISTGKILGINSFYYAVTQYAFLPSSAPVVPILMMSLFSACTLFSFGCDARSQGAIFKQNSEGWRLNWYIVRT